MLETRLDHFAECFPDSGLVRTMECTSVAVEPAVRLSLPRLLLHKNPTFAYTQQQGFLSPIIHRPLQSQNPS